MVRHLLSLVDLDQADFLSLIQNSASRSAGDCGSDALKGKCVGLYFPQTSTRTRTSFAVAALRLGACPLVYGPVDLQTNTGEDLSDTGRMFSLYLDAIVIRTAGNPEELRRMARATSIPIINAMTADEHPTQALSDLAMIKRHFGHLQNIRIVYFGQGNNTATALAFAVSRIAGAEIEFVTPEGYGLPSAALSHVQALSRLHGGRVLINDGPPKRIRPADVVYTTRWQTTGTFKADPFWRERFSPFRVTQSAMEELKKDTGTVFMHDLPAVRGEECDSAVLEAESSLVLEQARQKLFTAIAILSWATHLDEPAAASS